MYFCYTYNCKQTRIFKIESSVLDSIENLREVDMNVSKKYIIGLFIIIISFSSFEIAYSQTKSAGEKSELFTFSAGYRVFSSFLLLTGKKSMDLIDNGNIIQVVSHTAGLEVSINYSLLYFNFFYSFPSYSVNMNNKIPTEKLRMNSALGFTLGIGYAFGEAIQISMGFGPSALIYFYNGKGEKSEDRYNPSNSVQIGLGLLGEVQFVLFFTQRFGLSIGANGGSYFVIDRKSVNKGGFSIKSDMFVATGALKVGFAIK